LWKSVEFIDTRWGTARLVFTACLIDALRDATSEISPSGEMLTATGEAALRCAERA
jgi:hypothetical protein